MPAKNAATKPIRVLLSGFIYIVRTGRLPANQERLLYVCFQNFNANIDFDRSVDAISCYGVRVLVWHEWHHFGSPVRHNHLFVERVRKRRKLHNGVYQSSKETHRLFLGDPHQQE